MIIYFLNYLVNMTEGKMTQTHIEEPYLVFDTEFFRLECHAYDLKISDIDKRVRVYIQLLDTFHDNTKTVGSFWSNVNSFFNAYERIHKIAKEYHLIGLRDAEMKFVYSMQKRYKEIKINENKKK